jgi:hypothetical protein
MSGCGKYLDMIADYQSGDVTPEELMEMEDHAAGCADCRALLDLHAGMTALGDAAPEPTDDELAFMRAGVSRRIGAERADAAAGSFWADLKAFLGVHPMAAAPVAAMVLAAAVLFGRWTVSPAGGGDVLMDQLALQATQRLDAGEYLDNPLTYTNVSVRSRGDRLALSFDVCRHVEMETDGASPVARDVLLAAIVDAPMAGQRLRAIQLSPTIDDDRLRGALAFTLCNDPDLSVRLEALDALAKYPDAPEVREAMLQTLGADPSVQMRLIALDHLAGRRVDPGVLRAAITTRPLEGDAALLQRTVQLQRRES